MLLLNDNATTLDLIHHYGLADACFGRTRTDEAKRQSALRGIDQLEQLPLHPRAETTRARLLCWVVESPEFSVQPNPHFLARLLSTDRAGARALAAQLVLSTTAYALRNPQAAADQRRLDRAGALGVLRAYRQMRTARPEVRWEFLEALLERTEREVRERRSGAHPIAA